MIYIGTNSRSKDQHGLADSAAAAAALNNTFRIFACFVCSDKFDFMHLPELLNVGVAEEKDGTLFIAQYLPRLWNSVPSILIHAMVKHRLVLFQLPLLWQYKLFSACMDI